MKARTSFLVAAALCCVAAWAADTTSLNVKTGEWESTITVQTAGQLPIPQEALDKMTPQQRAKIDAAIKAQGGQPRTTVSKSCVRKEDLDKPFSNIAQRESCKSTVLTSTATRQELRMECEMDGGKLSGTLKLEAVDSGDVKGTMQMVASNGGRTINVNTNFAAKWLGPRCTESDNK